MGAPQYEQAGADIGGTGTTNTIPRWTGPSTLGDSGITDNGTTVSFVSRNLSSTAAQTWTLATSTSALNIASGLLNLDTQNSRLGLNGITTPLATVHALVAKTGAPPTAPQWLVTYDTSGNFRAGFAFSFNGADPTNCLLQLYASDGTATGSRLFLQGNGSGTVFVPNGNLVLGSGDATGTPVGNTLRAPAGAGTNIAGGSLTIAGGASTGTGAGGSIIFQTAAAGGAGSGANALTERWRINSSGHLLAGADNTYDIGASGATRPRTVYAGTSVIVGPSATAAGTNANAIGANCTASGSNAFAAGLYATASALGAVAVGAYNNATATGAAAIGQYVAASGIGSLATGYSSVAPRRGQHAHSSSGFSGSGDAQKSLLVAQRETTSAAASKLTLDAGALVAGNALSLPNNTAWAADVHLVARSATGAGHAYFVRRVLIKRDANAASTALVGTVQTIGTDIGSNAGAPPAGWAITITADTTNGALDLEVTGAAGTTIRWVARVELVEVALA